MRTFPRRWKKSLRGWKRTFPRRWKIWLRRLDGKIDNVTALIRRTNHLALLDYVKPAVLVNNPDDKNDAILFGSKCTFTYMKHNNRYFVVTVKHCCFPVNITTGTNDTFFATFPEEAIKLGITQVGFLNTTNHPTSPPTFVAEDFVIAEITVPPTKHGFNINCCEVPEQQLDSPPGGALLHQASLSRRTSIQWKPSWWKRRLIYQGPALFCCSRGICRTRKQRYPPLFFHNLWDAWGVSTIWVAWRYPWYSSSTWNGPLQSSASSTKNCSSSTLQYD